MLNVGSVREGERLLLHDVPWKVETIHVFCSLFNPALGIHLRLPIEDIVGMVSRPYSPEEPWFPCQKGDWVVVGDRPRTRVVSLSHEMVETVERGGKRYLFKTADFLGQNLVNLSRNFRLRVVFGVSYDLQDQVTSTIPNLLQTFIEEKLAAEGYADNCLNLLVEFKEAGASSLDLQYLLTLRESWQISIQGLSGRSKGGVSMPLRSITGKFPSLNSPFIGRLGTGSLLPT